MIGLSLLLAGGLSTGSKVFLGSLILFAGHVVLTRSTGLGSSIPRVLRFSGIASAAAISIIPVDLANLDRFWAFFGALGSDLGTVTGGRNQSLGEWWGRILGDVSVLGSQRFFTDDAIRAYLTGGGVVGLILVVMVYRKFFRISESLPRHSSERHLAFGLTSVTLAASIGSVSLQTIRASSVFWVLMALLLGHAHNLRSTPEGLARSRARHGVQAILR